MVEKILNVTFLAGITHVLFQVQYSVNMHEETHYPMMYDL